MPDVPLNYTRISPGLGCCGQPARGEWDWIAAQGYQTVINLALDSSPNALPDEAELCAARSIHYIHIPVVWTAPTLDDLARFFDAMESNGDKAVLVHCALNYRASAFVYLWRVLRCNELQKIARPDMLAVWKPDETWQAFIDRALAGG